jgi:biopolymer transport protein ExbB/TolQ
VSVRLVIEEAKEIMVPIIVALVLNAISLLVAVLDLVAYVSVANDVP